MEAIHYESFMAKWSNPAKESGRLIGSFNLRRSKKEANKIHTRVLRSSQFRETLSHLILNGGNTFSRSDWFPAGLVGRKACPNMIQFKLIGNSVALRPAPVRYSIIHLDILLLINFKMFGIQTLDPALHGASCSNGVLLSFDWFNLIHSAACCMQPPNGVHTTSTSIAFVCFSCRPLFPVWCLSVGVHRFGTKLLIPHFELTVWIYTV